MVVIICVPIHRSICGYRLVRIDGMLWPTVGEIECNSGGSIGCLTTGSIGCVIGGSIGCLTSGSINTSS